VIPTASALFGGALVVWLMLAAVVPFAALFLWAISLVPSDSPRGPACGDTGGAPATPDGNHGDNDFGVTK